MDNRSEGRDFLASRRARVSPEQAGLISYGARRVPGLRRAELAQLAGVSIEYSSGWSGAICLACPRRFLDSLVAARPLMNSAPSCRIHRPRRGKTGFLGWG